MNRKRVLILAEGYEEKYYIDKIISFPCMSKSYYFEPVINLKGNGQIIPRYQYLFQLNKYDLILVFGDGDNGSDQFIRIIEGLGKLIFGDENKGRLVFIFVNPVTMQIILSHFEKVCLTHKAKMKNRSEIERITGIKDYDAKEEQIKELVGMINLKNYSMMKENIKDLSIDYKECPSSNILSFLEKFENDDSSWIDEINAQITLLM